MNTEVQFLVFRLDDRRYALRLTQVHQVVRSVDYTPIPSAPEIVLGIIDFRGEILPLLKTGNRFGHADRPVRLEDQFIIARTARRTVALLVDEVNEVVALPSERIIAATGVIRDSVPKIQGVAQFDDGLILIHDLETFLSQDEEQSFARALASGGG